MSLMLGMLKRNNESRRCWRGSKSRVQHIPVTDDRKRREQGKKGYYVRCGMQSTVAMQNKSSDDARKRTEEKRQKRTNESVTHGHDRINTPQERQNIQIKML